MTIRNGLLDARLSCAGERQWNKNSSIEFFLAPGNGKRWWRHALISAKSFVSPRLALDPFALKCRPWPWKWIGAKMTPNWCLHGNYSGPLWHCGLPSGTIIYIYIYVFQVLVVSRRSQIRSVWNDQWMSSELRTRGSSMDVLVRWNRMQTSREPKAGSRQPNPEKCDESESERFSADWGSPFSKCPPPLPRMTSQSSMNFWRSCMLNCKNEISNVLDFGFGRLPWVLSDVLWLKSPSRSKRIYGSPATHLPLQIRGSQVEMKACEEAMLCHHKSIRIHKVTQKPNKNIEKGRWHHGTI